MSWTERIGRRLKLRDLHILFAVVQCGSMTKAARQLSVSKPVVSKAIADLEHTLGVRLLDRSSDGIEPTGYGNALLSRGLGAFDELRQAVKDIEALSDPTAGEVRIGTSIAIAAGFVPAVIARLSRRYPRMSFQVLAGEAATGVRALEERRVDLAVLRLHAPRSLPHLQSEVLYDDSYVVVAGAQTAYVRRRKIELAELIEEPWALPPPDSQLGSVFVEAFRSRGLEYPRATVSAQAMPARAALAATGRFLSVLPGSALRFLPGNTELKALPVDLSATLRPTGILRLKNRAFSPAAQVFVDCAREVAKLLAKSSPLRR